MPNLDDRGVPFSPIRLDLVEAEAETRGRWDGVIGDGGVVVVETGVVVATGIEEDACDCRDKGDGLR